MNERQYFQAREREVRRHKRRLRSLATAWVMLHGNRPPKHPTHKRREASGDSRPPLLTKALVDILSMMTGEFNTLDIDKVLRAEHPEIAVSRSSVSHTLKRLASVPSPIIAIVEIGKGKRPTTYRKLAANAPVKQVASGLEDL